MKPPPPRLPAAGHVTASASAVATAASTALPPFFITSTPMRDAISLVEATMPWRATTGSRDAATSGVGRRTSAMYFRMAGSLIPSQRQMQPRHRAARSVAAILQSHGAAVRFGDHAAQRESDAAAARLRGEERDEQVRGAADAVSVVDHMDVDGVIGGRPGDADVAPTGV